jgi:hypothetical protein
MQGHIVQTEGQKSRSRISPSYKENRKLIDSVLDHFLLAGVSVMGKDPADYVCIAGAYFVLLKAFENDLF